VTDGGPLAADAVLLDLDGTLLDTATDLTTAANRTLAEFGREPVAEAQVRDWIGDGVRALVASFMEATGGQVEGAYERFLAHYGECFSEQSYPYPGVPEALERLRAMALPLAVITNKAAAFTEPLLAATGLTPYLDCVVSGDTLPQKKPDPAPVHHAAGQLGVAPARAVFVGDSANDVAAGRAAGCPVVCVSYGYNRGIDPRELGADRVIDSFDELPSCLLLPQEGGR
jgi:phosphoglycolate phosphatase